MKSTTTIIISLLLLASFLLLGGCSKYPEGSTGEEGTLTATTLGFVKDGVYHSLNSLDEDTLEVCADFTLPAYTWQIVDPNGYEVWGLTPHRLAMAYYGVWGSMLDSVYVGVGDPGNRFLLTGLSTNLDGNYSEFTVYPDFTLENAGDPVKYWVAFYHGVLDSNDAFEGSVTNWSRRASFTSWLATGNSDHIFHVLENGEYVVDTSLYAISYDLDGIPIDIFNVQTALEHGEDWHPACHLDANGYWTDLGSPIRIWIGGP